MQDFRLHMPSPTTIFQWTFPGSSPTRASGGRLQVAEEEAFRALQAAEAW